jgi:hypothetical protein
MKRKKKLETKHKVKQKRKKKVKELTSHRKSNPYDT